MSDFLDDFEEIIKQTTEAKAKTPLKTENQVGALPSRSVVDTEEVDPILKYFEGGEVGGGEGEEEEVASSVVKTEIASDDLDAILKDLVGDTKKKTICTAMDPESFEEWSGYLNALLAESIPKMYAALDRAYGRFSKAQMETLEKSCAGCFTMYRARTKVQDDRIEEEQKRQGISYFLKMFPSEQGYSAMQAITGLSRASLASLEKEPPLYPIEEVVVSETEIVEDQEDSVEDSYQPAFDNLRMLFQKMDDPKAPGHEIGACLNKHLAAIDEVLIEKGRKKSGDPDATLLVRQWANFFRTDDRARVLTEILLYTFNESTVRNRESLLNWLNSVANTAAMLTDNHRPEQEQSQAITQSVANLNTYIMSLRKPGLLVKVSAAT